RTVRGYRAGIYLVGFREPVSRASPFLPVPAYRARRGRGPVTLGHRCTTGPKGHKSPPAHLRASSHGGPAALTLPRHVLGEIEPRLNDRVRIQRHALDALLEQPLGEIRVVRRPLAADTDVLAAAQADLYRHREQLLHGLVPLVEERRD